MAMEIKSGQVWRQPEFPYFGRLVFWLTGHTFLLLSVPGPSEGMMACTDEHGKMFYTKEEIAALFDKFNYKLTNEKIAAYNPDHPWFDESVLNA